MSLFSGEFTEPLGCGNPLSSTMCYFLAMCLQILFWTLSLLSIWYSLCTSWYTWQLCTGLWGSVHFLLCLTALHIFPGLCAHPGMPDGFAQVFEVLCTLWYAWRLCTGLQGFVHTLVCLRWLCIGFWSSVHILVCLITLYKSSKLFLFSFTHLWLCSSEWTYFIWLNFSFRDSFFCRSKLFWKSWKEVFTSVTVLYFLNIRIPTWFFLVLTPIFFLRFHFYFLYMGVLLRFISGVWRGQKTVSDPLGLVLQTIVSHHAND